MSCNLRLCLAAVFALLLAAVVGRADDWGAVKGRVVWSAAELPKLADLDVSKDKDHCLKNGPIKDESFVVDAKSRGVKNVFIYLKFRGQPSIHPDFPQTAAQVEERFKADFEKLNGMKFDDLKSAHASGKLDLKKLKAPALIDQLHCTYVPRSLAVREGMPVLALNAEPIAHNVKVTSTSGKNDANPIMPANTFEVFRWSEDKGLLGVECSIHGWMRMYAMVYDHPYFAVTDEKGEFVIEKAPAGERDLVVRHPQAFYIDAKSGGKGTARGAKIAIPAGQTLDLGDIKFAP